MKALDIHTRLVIVDHITSPTAVILPVAEIAHACREKGVLCLIDGAHAPGMIPLNIDEIGADWYTGNLHKWVCAPKGCAFLVASTQTETWTHPETTSHMHGHGFAEEFDWQGTRDFAPWLTIPTAIEFVCGGFPGGIREHNHQLATWAQKKLCLDFGTRSISPIDGSMIGSMATITLPPAISMRFASAADFQATLYDVHKIEVPIIDWGGVWHSRVSAQAYNCPEDYLALSAAVCSEALVR
jgi:isopenicillin-N epimerase